MTGGNSNATTPFPPRVPTHDLRISAPTAWPVNFGSTAPFRGAPPVGFEPTTCGLEVPCSIQLSYRGSAGQLRCCQHALGFEAPSGWHWVLTVGDLRGWIFRVFTAEVKPGLETTTVMTVPAFSGFVSSGASETLRDAFVLLKDFLAQDRGQEAVTVAPAGTFLTTRDVSLVSLRVELA